MGWVTTASPSPVSLWRTRRDLSVRTSKEEWGGNEGLPHSQKITLKLIIKNFISSSRSTEGLHLGREEAEGD